ncbi:MAG: TlpA disulfide reductase family protein [Candidatus Acidiferrum sp.]
MTLPPRLVRRLPRSRKTLAAVFPAIAFCALLCSTFARAGEFQDPSSGAPPEKAAGTKSAAQAKQSPERELQQSIESAGSDRAALVRNLEAFLKKYPESPSRIQIYRALVEADLQLQDNAHATEYAERIVALSPEDISMTMLTIELLERNGDEAALKRATTYATRVLDFIQQDSADKRSQRVSLQEWQAEHQRDQMSVLVLRGRLYLKLKEPDFARRDLSAGYALLPNASAAERLGEIAEMNKASAEAARQYARAFALADSAKSTPSRREIREKLGNVWRQAHGSDAGLGDFILAAFDEVSRASGPVTVTRNANAKTAFDFTLRNAETGAPFPLLPYKGRILVVNFWATWCGPCRALAPLLEHVRQGFQNDDAVQFLGANCDEDESLVAPYLAVEQPKMNMVFADGLDRLLAITSFPTVVVLDREGKIVYRSEGFGDQGFETELSDAIRHATADAPAAPATPASVGAGR